MSVIYTLHALERPFTGPEIRNHVEYLVAQIALGNTDGVQIGVTRAGLEHVQNLRQTRWKTVEAANAYLAWLNALTVPPTFAHSFTFGEPQSWAENVTDTSPNQAPA